MRTSKSDLAQVIRLVESNDRAAVDQFGGGLKTLFGVPLLPMLHDLRDSLTMEQLHVNPTLHNVVNNLVDERRRQDEKWGGARHDDQHTVAEFVQWIEDYAGWARMMDSMRSPEKARRRLLQVAALAVAAVEKIDREQESGPGEEDGSWAEGWTDRTYEALGWMHAACCAALERGEDPRELEVPALVEQCRRDLCRDAASVKEQLQSLRRVEEVATIETSDPRDERPGFWLSTNSRRTLESLPPGTKLYVEVEE